MRTIAQAEKRVITESLVQRGGIKPGNPGNRPEMIIPGQNQPAQASPIQAPTRQSAKK